MPRQVGRIVAAAVVMFAIASPVLAACEGWASPGARRACCAAAAHDCDGARIDACCAQGESREHAEKVTSQTLTPRAADLARVRLPFEGVGSASVSTIPPPFAPFHACLRISVLLI